MKKILIIAVCFLISCSATISQVQEFSGSVNLGPEAMYFIEFGSEERWWISESSFTAEGWEKIEQALNMQPRCSLETMPCAHQSVSVLVSGAISEPGQYGHMGQYRRKINLVAIKQSQ